MKKQLRAFASIVIFLFLLSACGSARKAKSTVVVSQGTQTQASTVGSNSGSTNSTSTTNTWLNSSTTNTSTVSTTTSSSTNGLLVVYYNWVNTSTIEIVYPTPIPTIPIPVVPIIPARAETGRLHRMIDHYFTLPSDTSTIGRMVIRRQLGAVAPASCNAGNFAFDFSGPFTGGSILTFNDDTLSELGEMFSYRVCVYDKQGNLGREARVEGVYARDARSPDPLVQFNEGTTTIDATIALNIKYPASTIDYRRVEIRRVAGSTAPAENCTEGTVVKIILHPFADFVWVDNSVIWETGNTFSYRACIYDGSENLTNVNVAAGLKKYSSAKWYSALNQNCPSFCSSMGKTNIASPEGNYCASGEVWTKSVQDAGITRSYGCYGTGCYALTSIKTATSDRGYCYMTGQTPDDDNTDRTLACYCK